MADLSITASGVVPQANAVLGQGIAFEAIAIGAPVYADPNNSYQIRNALAAVGTPATSNVLGIAVTQSQGAGQQITFQRSGNMTLTGTTMSVGMVYMLSANSGKIAPVADYSAATTNTLYATFIGIAITATNLLLGITPAQVLRV